MDDLFTDAARQLLGDQCTPHRVRAIEAGGSAQALWSFIEQAGFADALVPEAHSAEGAREAFIIQGSNTIGARLMPALIEAFAGSIDWYHGSIALVGVTIGSYVAARLSYRIPTRIIRALVLVYGVGLTLYFFWKTYWA